MNAPLSIEGIKARKPLILYRLRQFFQGLSAHISPGEMALAAQLLPAAAFTLFARLPADAQRHSLNVLYTLQQAGYADPDLAVAALLHDVGKLASDEAGVRLGLWLRGPLVMLEMWAPQLLAKLALPFPQAGWRYALYVHVAHPQIGARWASQAGCTPLACWLIEHHQTVVTAQDDKPRYHWLLALQQADNTN